MTAAPRPYRYVIAGGGSAACVLAARLSEDPDSSVLLLEAGRDIRSAADLPAVIQGLHSAKPDESGLWRYEVELVAGGGRPGVQYRGRALGGSSTVNGSLFMRGVPEDYDAWGERWRFDEVLPYFKKSENDWDFHDEFHGDDGPFDVTRGWAEGVGPFQQRFVDAALAVGIPEKRDLNSPFGGGVGYMPLATYRDERTCASLAYLADLRDRPNLEIRTGAVVRRVLIDHGRAIGVEARIDGESVTFAGTEIICSGGTFGTPEILLRSGIGPAGELAASGITPLVDLPGVGQSLSCHPSVVVRVDTDQSGDDPDKPRIGVVCSSEHGTADERNDLTLFPRVIEGRGTVLVTLRQPSGTGSVRIAGEGAGALEINYEYLAPSDRERLRDGVRAAFAVLGREPAEELSDAWILGNLRTPEHACGTCRLGPADDQGTVVDEECRVVGVSGLRVVDLSVVPRSVRAGPYATVIMVAERAADLIRGGAGGGG